MEPAVIPLCLYTNHTTSSSYIGLPTKEKKGDNVVLSCNPKPDTELVASFYALNPDIRPIPPGTVLMCAKDTETDDFSTIDLEPIYDPFDIDQKCIRFIAWLSPVPYTTPLYVMKFGNSVYMSFEKKLPGPEYQEIYFSPIHVLIDPRIDAQRIHGHKKGPKGFSVKDGQPQFLFSVYQGRCIPDPTGVSLGRCLVENVLESENQPTMLKHLEKIYGGKPDWKLVILVLGVILAITVCVFVIKMKKSKR